MELLQTAVVSWPLVLGVGALLLGIGWGLKRLAYGPVLKRWGDEITKYGVMAVVLAIALWLLRRFLEAYGSGAV
jgi:hypothetical protein